ncbi:hypothetical protein MFIFM68171_00021 [Madurella fahalii]|uniref:Uncharacterized protein n=1 Tax=Madurella fahalii TaxID=1157608 RepID=A0ABQ0FWD7_9PEZI
MPSLESFRNFQNQSYPPLPTFTATDVPPGSQRGRVFIVTGGNSGIGFGLCKWLYATGATVYIASRSKERVEAAIRTIIVEAKPASTNGTLKCLDLDLNDLGSVKAAATSFGQQESKLDILWNNAGMGGNRVAKGQRTAQGLEPMMGIHCVATLLFTILLLPQLRAAAVAEKEANGGEFGGKTRVLWISSGMAETDTPKNGIDFPYLDGLCMDKVKNYSISKAGVWFLGREFARRYNSRGILSLPVNPGNLKTNAWEGTAAPIMWVFNAVMLYNAIYGSHTLLYAGLSPDLNMKHSGTHIIPWGRIRPDDEIVPRRDLLEAMKSIEEGGLGYASRLWEWCEMKWKPYV